MRKVTELSLWNATLHHVQRHPSTASGLARVLERKAKASVRKSGDPLPEALSTWIASVVEKAKEAGHIDDTRLATAKARTLRARGKSGRAVSAALRAKGVSSDVIADVAAAAEPDADRTAAWTLARKKKLGPYREAADRKALRQKDLAAMARSGFGYGLAAQIIDAEEPPDGPPLTVWG